MNHAMTSKTAHDRDHRGNIGFASKHKRGENGDKWFVVPAFAGMKRLKRLKNTTLPPQGGTTSAARRLLWLSLMVVAILGTQSDRARGQDVIPPKPLGVTISASLGPPFGVAVIDYPLGTPQPGPTHLPLDVRDPAKRIFFPFGEDLTVPLLRPSERPVPRPGRGRLLGRVRNLLQEITREDQPKFQTVARRVTFLFVGDTPMSVELSESGNTLGRFDVVPKSDPLQHTQTMKRWWQGYTDAAKRQMDSADYPTSVEAYLVAMLSGRLQLPLPTWYTLSSQDTDHLVEPLKLMTGSPKIARSVFRHQAAGLNTDSQAASVPIPSPPTWGREYTKTNHDVGAKPVEIEPIARKVPVECFYIRYGSFENYLWFLDLTEEYGGDLSSMVSLRSVESNNAKRMEEQLSIKTTEMSRLFGPKVIADQAIIGRDLSFGEGASIGVLFQAKNAFLLRTSLRNDRSKRAQGDDAVTLQEIRIDDHPVTFLSSADNRVRSFMAESDDGFFLISNSRTIVKRFFEVGAEENAKEGAPDHSGRSLADSASFQLARQLMPLERNDTLFAYFSPQMLRGLISPKSLIELRRRLAAKSEISMVHLAQYAARQEGVLSRPGETMGIEGLRSAGFLPVSFGVRPDGSGIVEVGENVMDTLRGDRGTFLPIADVTIDQVTPEEAAWYSRIAQEYSRRFSTIDPIMVGVQRQPVDPATGMEQVSIHAEIAPLRIEKYGEWARFLGPPTRVAMQFPPDDIVTVQAHVASEQLGPPTHLFAAIKDTTPPQPEDFDGILNIYRSLKSIPGYLGAWPQPGTLDRLPLGLGRGQPVGPGMSRLVGGLYRYSDGSYSILSFWPDLLKNCLRFLNSVDVPHEAQVRIQIDSLAGSQIEGWVNEQLYLRSRTGSVAGANFLSMLQRQLGISAEEAEQAAARIGGANLQCALGGKYQHSPPTQRWISTAWGATKAPYRPPVGYTSPVLGWFRGGQASLTQYVDRLVVDATIRIQRTEKH